MTHGRREYFDRTLASFGAMVKGPVTRIVVHDDSADADFHGWVRRRCPAADVVIPGPERIGAGPSVASAWRYLVEHGDTDWVFHLEDDFTFNRAVDLADLIALLDVYPYLAQMSFRRQPWGAEIPYGGFEYQAPGWYHEMTDDHLGSWLETTRNFTLNPTIYRRQLCGIGWPDGANSEGYIGPRICQAGLLRGIPGEAVRFGYWGSWDSGRAWVEHIGIDRAGGHTY